MFRELDRRGERSRRPDMMNPMAMMMNPHSMFGDMFGNMNSMMQQMNGAFQVEINTVTIQSEAGDVLPFSFSC